METDEDHRPEERAPLLVPRVRNMRQCGFCRKHKQPSERAASIGSPFCVSGGIHENHLLLLLS